MKRQIVIDSEGRSKLQKIFDISRVMVWKALTFESDSVLARKIRHTAISQMGGVEVGIDSAKAPEHIDTTHTADGEMVQRFGQRVVIIFNKETGHTRLTVDGKDTRVTTIVKVEDMMLLQQEAQQMAESMM